MILHIQSPYIPCTKPHVSFTVLRSYQMFSPGPSYMYPFRKKASFYGEKLLKPRPTPKLEEYALSSVHDCLFNIFAPTLHIGSHSSISNLRTQHTVVTRPLYPR